MNIRIEPGVTTGRVTAPPSKSMAHRLLIGAGLSEGVSRIAGIAPNEDVLATIDCLNALGAKCTLSGDTVTVQGVNPKKSAPITPLGCRESGSTLRFFIPLALLGEQKIAFTGSDTLLSRPLGVYADLCEKQKLFFSRENGKVTVGGPLSPGRFDIPGDISSQFITGLLFALPLLEADSVLRLIPPVESRSYIDLTLSALAAFGVKAHWQDDYTLLIPGNQRYRAADKTVEGDYSGAAFFGALSVLNSEIEIAGLDPDSLQGDRVYARHLAAIAAGTPTIDITDCPDLGPVLFAAAAAKQGATFTGTRRLKIKESDRAAAMAEELKKFGTVVTVNEDSVVVDPVDFHRPNATLFGHNDHRIVMSLAVLLTLTGGEMKGAEAVCKSFPDFFHKLSALHIPVKEVISDET